MRYDVESSFSFGESMFLLLSITIVGLYGFCLLLMTRINDLKAILSDHDARLWTHYENIEYMMKSTMDKELINRFTKSLSQNSKLFISKE